MDFWDFLISAIEVESIRDDPAIGRFVFPPAGSNDIGFGTIAFYEFLKDTDFL